MRITLVIALAAALMGCKSAGDRGDSREEKRQAVFDMRDSALKELYKHKPDTKAQIANAAGYAVFDSAGLKILLVSTGNAYGVHHNNKSGEDTIMKMVEGGVGLGLGFKDYKAIFVFHTEEALNEFKNKGWEASGDADATAQVSTDEGKKGAGAGTKGTARKSISTYYITKGGLSLQANVKGTKFYVDDKLN